MAISVAGITGLSRFELDPVSKDFGHILPAHIVAARLGDNDLTDDLRRKRTYPARLRLSRRAFDDLLRLIGTDARP